MRTHFKPTETFQYTHFSSCHPPGVRKGFIKGEALRLLRTNSSKTTFEFKQRLHDRGYLDNLTDKTLTEVNFNERMSALQNKQKTHKNILPFVTEYRPSVPNLKTILMSKWHLIEYQPMLRDIYKDPPLLSYRKGRSLKDVLVRANFEGHIFLISTNRSRVWPVIIILPRTLSRTLDMLPSTLDFLPSTLDPRPKPKLHFLK